MKRISILYGVIGLLAGIVIMGFTARFAVNNNHEAMMNMMDMHTDITEQAATSHDTMSMVEMTEQLKDKIGDDFDKAFVEMMISHHEGAIEMAKLIPDRAKHEELKNLSKAIIAAQTKEVQDMKQWQLDWGYSGNEMMQMMHGSN